MSERGEAAVLLPVGRYPETSAEFAPLMRSALSSVRELVRPTGGRVVSFLRVERTTDPHSGDPALKVFFAVEAPESNFERPKVFAF